MSRFGTGSLSIAILFALSLGLTGCSILPGMNASFDKSPIVTESPEEPTDIDYTLLLVTPLLVKQLTEQADAKAAESAKNLPQPTVPSYPYRLGAQDTLRIFVWGHPDLTPVTSNITSTTAASTPTGRTIDSQGKIFFPLVGEMNASGMTVNEFRTQLTKRLSKYIPDPQVEVDVAAFRNQKVFIAGAVTKPGVVPITDQPLRVTDAIGNVGGALENADLYDVVLTRGKESVRLNLDRLYYSGDLNINVLLTDGDVISVPDRMSRKVFMLGEVGNSVGSNQARSYVMRRGRMTLAEVISDAGGVSPFSAAANEIYVMRVDPNATNPAEAARKPLVYKLDAWQPEALLMAEQFPIQPRDVIFVNPTGPTMIGRFIGQFFPVLTTVNTVGNSPF
jgi:polysaccharide export outer membrane protein